jgi:hypothetical protein
MKVIGKALLAMLEWAMHHVMRVVLVVAAIWTLGYIWYVKGPEWSRGPVLTPQEQKVQERQRIDDAFVDCAVLAAVDDAATPEERLMMAVTVINVANDRAVKIEKEEGGKKIIEMIADTCDVASTYETLRVPGAQPGIPRFKTVLHGVIEQHHFDETNRELREYLKDPTQFLAKWPWLSQSRRYIRTTWPRSLYPMVDNEAMRKSLCRLYGEPGKTAEFFRYKKTPDEICPP